MDFTLHRQRGSLKRDKRVFPFDCNLWNTRWHSAWQALWVLHDIEDQDRGGREIRLRCFRRQSRTTLLNLHCRLKSVKSFSRASVISHRVWNSRLVDVDVNRFLIYLSCGWRKWEMSQTETKHLIHSMPNFRKCCLTANNNTDHQLMFPSFALGCAFPNTVSLQQDLTVEFLQAAEPTVRIRKEEILIETDLLYRTPFD